MTTGVAPLQDKFWRVCERVLYRHANPWELDEALVAWGYSIGPCEAPRIWWGWMWFCRRGRGLT